MDERKEVEVMGKGDEDCGERREEGGRGGRDSDG